MGTLPFFLGNQYGPGASIFGGQTWLINGEGLLGMVLNGSLTVILVRSWHPPERLQNS